MKHTNTFIAGVLFIALLSSCAFAQGRYNHHNEVSQLSQATDHQGQNRAGQWRQNQQGQNHQGQWRQNQQGQNRQGQWRANLQGQNRPHPNWTQRPPNEKIQERIRNRNVFNGGQGRNWNRGQNSGNHPGMQNSGNQNTGADEKYNNNWFFGKPGNKDK